MGRGKSPKALKLTLDIFENERVYISEIEFDSVQMSDQWNTTFVPYIHLNDEGDAEVQVFVRGFNESLIPINRSPFTGGDIVTLVPEKLNEDIKQLLAVPEDDGNLPFTDGQRDVVEDDLEEVDDEEVVDEDEEYDDEEYDDEELAAVGEDEDE